MFRLRKPIDPHRCATFTEWKVCEAPFYVHLGVRADPANIDRCRVVRIFRWQERHCTECGKTYQQPLSF